MKAKNVLIGICGGISAYKVPFLVRGFIKKGYNVKVVLTPNAKRFISMDVLATLSKNPVYSSSFSSEVWKKILHIELANWANCFVIAPLTVNTLGKIAQGISDNLLLDCYFSFSKKVLLCPAMDLEMYKNPFIQNNIDTVKKQSRHIFLGPNEGLLASGLMGKGRMSEPEEILKKTEALWSENLALKDKKIMISVGSTREKIDPVRYVSNFSSGKMGLALVKSALNQGAEVTLIASNIETPFDEHDRLKIVKTTSTQEMLDTCIQHFPKINAFIMCAAVSDYKPSETKLDKIKKSRDTIVLKLKRNPDILFELGKMKKTRIFIGFSLETHENKVSTKEKIKEKKLDFLVQNVITKDNPIFGSDYNSVSIWDSNCQLLETLNKTSKTEIANRILSLLSF